MNVGRLGNIEFKKGYYAYVGSALGGFKIRLTRHFKPYKTNRWHIDYLTNIGKVTGVFIWQSKNKIEDKIACKLLKKFEFISDFGSSDSKCKSHLFYAESKEKIISALFKSLRRECLFIEFE